MLGMYFALHVTRLMPKFDLEFISEWSSSHIYVKDGLACNSIEGRGDDTRLSASWFHRQILAELNSISLPDIVSDHEGRNFSI